ncbi:MAG: hypothetical protein HOV79_06965 [Hamadaea sp.]|nr:hypothetical protein [Hamadaea sp.]
MNDSRSVSRGDVATVAAVVLLLATAAVVGLSVGVEAATPPLYALWRPHTGPGSLPAIAVAVAVTVWGARVAERLSWWRLLLTAYLVSVVWTLSLALVDGWRDGVTRRLTVDQEYLAALPVAGDIPTMIRTYAGRIVDFQPDSWNTQAAGHPPGPLLIFAVLDRIGLPGGVPAGLLCVAVGAVAAVAVPCTLRSLGDEGAARAAVPFVVLFPGAVWVGVSADGLFLGVTTAAMALLAAGTRRPWPAALSGVLFGFACFLSYGMVLMAPLVVAVALSVRRIAAVLWAALTASGVFAAFAAAGFWWFDGYAAVRIRYYQGIAANRPYWYWLWANLGALAVSAGPAAFVVARRSVLAARLRTPAVLLSLAAVVAILVADMSGMSKAEVERIWLPFAVWLLAGATLLPRRSRTLWLGVQAATALAVNHMFHTVW